MPLWKLGWAKTPQRKGMGDRGGLVERLAVRGVQAGDGRRLLVPWDGSPAIAQAVGRIWPEVVHQTFLCTRSRICATTLRAFSTF